MTRHPDKPMTSNRRSVITGALTSVAALSVGGGAWGANRAQGGRSSLHPFAVNIETWWRDVPLDQRMAKAAQAGFGMLEMWWLDEDARRPETLRTQASDHGVEIVHCAASLPPLAAASSSEAHQSAEIQRDLIGRLGVRYATVASHQSQKGMSLEEMKSRYKDRLTEVTPLFEEAGILLLVEPFNRFDHPEAFLIGSTDAVEIVDAINSSAVKLNWDFFHMQRAEGNVIDAFEKNAGKVGYIQIADSPDRHEPGTGEMNYAQIIARVLKAGYQGPIGLECFPKDGDEDAAVRAISALR